MKQKIQIVLLVAIAVAATRTAYILYRRHADKIEQAKNQPPPLNPDYYVIPKKLYPYDLKSAGQLTQQPVWVKEGYRYTYFAYDPVRRHADFSHEAGLLLPIEKLQIKNIVTDAAPDSAGQRQVMAIFEKSGKTYAFQIGVAQGGSYQIYSDELLYIQDPRELYKHWPAEVWDAIEKHEVKAGMNEFQVAFAIGMGIPERTSEARTSEDRSSEGTAKTVNYPNGGKPVSITYRDGKAAEITYPPPA